MFLFLWKVIVQSFLSFYVFTHVKTNASNVGNNISEVLHSPGATQWFYLTNPLAIWLLFNKRGTLSVFWPRETEPIDLHSHSSKKQSDLIRSFTYMCYYDIINLCPGELHQLTASRLISELWTNKPSFVQRKGNLPRTQCFTFQAQQLILIFYHPHSCQFQRYQLKINCLLNQH